MGKPGTGKTHLIHRIERCLRGVAVTATTGCAAENIGGNARTLHSKLGLGISPQAVAKVAERYRRHRSEVPAWLLDALLVIDEASMMSGPFLDAVEKLVRSANPRVRLVLVGDLPQLGVPSDDPPFYESEVEKRHDVHPTTAHRRRAEDAQILDRMREGYAQHTDVQWLTSSAAPRRTRTTTRSTQPTSW